MEPAKGYFWHYSLLWFEEVRFLLIFNPLGKLELYRGDLGQLVFDGLEFEEENADAGWLLLWV